MSGPGWKVQPSRQSPGFDSITTDETTMTAWGQAGQTQLLRAFDARGVAFEAVFG